MPETFLPSKSERAKVADVNTIGGKVPVGWVLYDGECAFCTKWVGLWERVLRRRGIGTSPLQARWVQDRLELSPDLLLYDIRLLTLDDKIISGANVYLYVWRRIWWAWPLYAIFSLPGFNQLMRLGYRWFARNRYCVSGTCRVKP